jgi:hypothetical protein
MSSNGELREQLLEVADAYGRLTPSTVVEAATPSTSPLHPRFEWDDQVAGHKYRLNQARQLIRQVRFVYREATPNEAQQSYRFFSSMPTDGSRAYRPTEEVLADPFARRMLVQQMHREMSALQQKYQHLTEWIEELDQLREAAVANGSTG